MPLYDNYSLAEINAVELHGGSITAEWHSGRITAVSTVLLGGEVGLVWNIMPKGIALWR